MYYRIYLKLFIIPLLGLWVIQAQATGAQQDWLDVIRKSPYNATKGFYENISVIRRWVLLEQGFCEKAERHILFNRRGHFLGYLDNLADTLQNQKALNEQREKLYNEGRVSFWSEGTLVRAGYPFALACNQPHVSMKESLSRMLGETPGDLVWGTWDGMKVGTQAAPLPLLDVVLQVYEQRNLQYGMAWSNVIMGNLLGQILVESGARKFSISTAQALGMLQMKAEVLNDCNIPQKFYLHRMAQVDCALKLYRQNHRNLQPVFEQTFGHLPAEKKDKLYAMLLVQAYHGGIGRITSLISDEDLGKAARYYADNHKDYSAEDIALGIVFHNMGRHHIGLASLYYLVDVEIATEALCKSGKLPGQYFC